MDGSFREILAHHMGKYPLMKVQDCVKLAYQHEFGPRHAAAEFSVLCADIRAELAVLPSGVSDSSARIGNGLKRFSLFELKKPEQDGELLARLLLRTAETHCGSMERFQRNLTQIASVLGAGSADWLDSYWMQGCPPVRHSAAYSAAYHPHYRLVREVYFDYFPALAAIHRKLQQGRPAVVAIDGRCGSGKSTLAALLQELFPCNVFHMDDFYLPPDRRPEHWMEIPAGNMDLPRFLEEVLLPARAGKAVLYRPFRCQTCCLEAAVPVPPSALTVVEGSYSHHPLLAEHYDLTLFLTCASSIQKGRLKKREGEGLHTFLDRWIPCEERYFQAFQTERRSAMVIDTSTFMTAPGPVRSKPD